MFKVDGDIIVELQTQANKRPVRLRLHASQNGFLRIEFADDPKDNPTLNQAIDIEVGEQITVVRRWDNSQYSGIVCAITPNSHLVFDEVREKANAIRFEGNGG